MVNVRRFAHKAEVVAFANDFAAALRFVQAQTDAGNRATMWDLFAGKPGKSGDRSCAA